MEGLVLDSKSQFKLDIVYKVYSGQIKRKDAMKLLAVSESTLKRYLKGFRTDGIAFVKHGNCGKEPKNKISNALKNQIQDLVQEKYYDFNMQHCLEKIDEELGIKIKRETFRSWCHEIGMVKKAKRRRGKPRYRRERMSQEGLLILMDGSYHRWFSGIESCLIATIDDATGEIPYAEFCYAETTEDCLRVLQKVIERKGIFKALYTDKAGVYGGGKRQNFSQVERALGELGINVIYANSPEAKGRVERLFGTLQDRLIPEMRLKGVKCLREANRFLQEEFLPNHYHPKFYVQAHNPISAYTKLNEIVDLKSIFCIKEYRIVNRDHTISLDGEKYLINSPLKYSIYKQRIEIRRTKPGKWEAFFAGRRMQVVKVQITKRLAA